MSSIGKILTLKPTDLTNVGKNLANIGSGIFVGAAITFTIYQVASAFLKPQTDGMKHIIATASSITGFAVTYLCAPQVTLVALSAEKIIQVVVLTALLMGVTKLAKPTDRLGLIALAALPTLGIVGGFLGKHAILVAGAVASIGTSFLLAKR